MKIIVELFWGYHVLLLILLIGIKLTIDTKFFQFRYFLKWIKESFNKSDDKDSISGFKALSTALAGSIGTGNIIGVSLAISIGGAGSIFWMWVASIFGMMTVFAEVSLSKKFQTDNVKVGAFTYISKVCKGKTLVTVYAVGCVCSSLAMGNMAQSNSFTNSMAKFNVPSMFSAIFLAIIFFILTKKGIQSISKLTGILVPFMTIFFMTVSLVLIVKCRENIQPVLEEIASSAFTLQSCTGGGLYIAMKTGISRSVFTNEAGLGLSSIVYSNVKGKSPKELGYLGIFQVFMDTIVMCTVTGFCILCATQNRTGEYLVYEAFTNQFGNFGAITVNLSTALFAFATMTATCYYGKTGLAFLTKNKFTYLFPYMFSLAAFIGALTPISLVFDICDVFNGLLAIPNLIALSCFCKEIIKITKE
ncbi:MAG: amino acid carrier protein [Clostridia bacterium]